MDSRNAHPSAPPDPSRSRAPAADSSRHPRGKSRRIPHPGWVILSSAVPFLWLIFREAGHEPTYGDLKIYSDTGSGLLHGRLPYRDAPLEYPPYSALPFALASIFGPARFILCFSLLMLVCDLAIKWVSCAVAHGASSSWGRLLPIAMLSACGLFQSHFYLERFDLVPALSTVLVVVLAARGRFFSAGVVLAFAAGAKLYPVLFIPPLLTLAARRSRGTAFLGGLTAGAAPLLAALFWVPWWRFLSFHLDRGLQVESLPASLLWYVHLLLPFELTWSAVELGDRSWFELTGPSARAGLAASRLLFPAAVLGSLWVAVRKARTMTQPHPAELARLLLLPLLAFTVWNIVFSPQYTIWSVALAALACSAGSRWPMVALAVASCATPLFYPTAQYGVGLELGQSAVLLLRNLCFLAVWIRLLAESWPRPAPDLTTGLPA